MSCKGLLTIRIDNVLKKRMSLMGITLEELANKSFLTKEYIDIQSVPTPVPHNTIKYLLKTTPAEIKAANKIKMLLVSLALINVTSPIKGIEYIGKNTPAIRKATPINAITCFLDI